MKNYLNQAVFLQNEVLLSIKEGMNINAGSYVLSDISEVYNSEFDEINTNKAIEINDVPMGEYFETLYIYKIETSEHETTVYCVSDTGNDTEHNLLELPLQAICKIADHFE